MKNYKTYLKNIILILIPLIALVSLGSLIVNRSFYFTELKNRIEVTIASENEGQLNEILNSLEAHASKALVDRGNSKVIFQYESLSEIEKFVTQFESDEVTIDTTEIIANNRYIVEHYFLAFILIWIITAGVTFYSVFKDRGKISLRELTKLFAPYSIIYILSTLIYTGMLSFASRFVYITELEFLNVYWINIVVSALFFLSLHGFENEERIELLNISRKILAGLQTYTIPFLIFLAATLPALTLSFGLNTIVVWISLLAAMLVVYLTIRWTYMSFYLSLDVNEIKGKFRRKKIKETKKYGVIQKNTVTKPSKPKKTSTTKKKKKKRTRK